MSKKTMLRDAVLYVAIGVVVVGSVIWLANYDYDHRVNRSGQMRWFAALVMSCWVFATVIMRNRKLWGLLRAWALWIALAGAHAGAWGLYLFNAPVTTRVPALLFALVSWLEIQLLSWLSIMVTRSTGSLMHYRIKSE